MLAMIAKAYRLECRIDRHKRYTELWVLCDARFYLL